MGRCLCLDLQSCRGAEVQRCRGAEVHHVEVQRCRGAGVHVQGCMCRGASAEVGAEGGAE